MGEFMHGHRKKALFFIRCLQEYRLNRRGPAEAIRVLDIGCGNGRNVSLPVAERGFDVTGLDVHGPSVEAARSENRLANARFMREAYEDHLSDHPYDAVILSDVLEHVHDPGAMLRAALRCLSPGGVMLISIPNGYGPFEIEQFLIRRGILVPALWLVQSVVKFGVRIKRLTLRRAPLDAPDAAPVSNIDSGHVQFFSRGGFLRLLKDNGLVIESRSNGAWFGGELTYFLFYFFPRLIPISLRAADFLPPALVSTWYFKCRRP
jgi:SAM-dependent methyltransferase